MSDMTAQLSTPESPEPIPAVLAAPKGKAKGKSKLAIAAPFVPAPATWPADASSSPTAAASADPHNEDTIMAVNFENTAATATDKTPFEKTGDVLAGVKDQAKIAMEKGTATVAELNAFAKGNVEALVESGKIAVAGMQTLAQAQAAYVRKQFEEATAAAKTFTTVKSPTEFVKLQGDYVRQQFDSMVAETSRSTEAMVKLVGEVAQPISNRFALAAEKIKQAA